MVNGPGKTGAGADEKRWPVAAGEEPLVKIYDGGMY
jgi:hypothetical protein